MSGQEVAPKYRVITAALERDIRTGLLEPGARIPGEHELARRFAVSRGTVRQALAVLARRRLIRTHPGSGSFVEFGGERLDWNLGWAEALARHGAQTTARVVRLEPAELPGLAAELGCPQSWFVVLERVRLLGNGDPVSLERSHVPLTGQTAGLLGADFARGSLMAALRSCGLDPVSGEEWVSVHRLGLSEAGLLERAEGEAFLRLRRVMRDAAGQVAEYAESLLDPDRFQVHVAFDPRKP
jgi:GntR family transcriptional regulator